jgi:hypothetical protein
MIQVAQDKWIVQHIGIVKLNESGEILEIFDVNFADIVNTLFEFNENFKKEYPWISTIDPYGDTIFNRIQIPFVLEDLTKLQKDNQKLLKEDFIEKMINSLKKVDTHEYVKFIGD